MHNIYSRLIKETLMVPYLENINNILLFYVAVKYE